MSTEQEKTAKGWAAVQKAVSEAYRHAQGINGEAGHGAALLLSGVSEAVYAWARQDMADLRATERAAAEQAQPRRTPAANPALSAFRKGMP